MELIPITPDALVGLPGLVSGGRERSVSNFDLAESHRGSLCEDDETNNALHLPSESEIPVEDEVALGASLLFSLCSNSVNNNNNNSNSNISKSEVLSEKSTLNLLRILQDGNNLLLQKPRQKYEKRGRPQLQSHDLEGFHLNNNSNTNHSRQLNERKRKNLIANHSDDTNDEDNQGEGRNQNHSSLLSLSSSKGRKRSKKSFGDDFEVEEMIDNHCESQHDHDLFAVDDSKKPNKKRRNSTLDSNNNSHLNSSNSSSISPQKQSPLDHDKKPRKSSISLHNNNSISISSSSSGSNDHPETSPHSSHSSHSSSHSSMSFLDKPVAAGKIHSIATKLGLCGNRECTQPILDSQTHQRIAYHSQSCQTREQNLRQGRVKNVSVALVEKKEALIKAILKERQMGK